MILTMISMTNLLMMTLSTMKKSSRAIKDDRDYVSINITESNDSADEEDEAGETPSTEDEE